MSRFGPRPFERLTPDTVLAALESAGLVPDGRLFALNSYENRVYQAGSDDGRRVLKFYRPERWSDQQILEEHAFALELAQAELPVVAPQPFSGSTLLRHQGFRFAIFPWRGGRAFDLDDSSMLQILGRLLGRMHLLGRTRVFRVRPTLTPQYLGWNSRDLVLSSGLMPGESQRQYASLVDEVLPRVELEFAAVQPLQLQRLHGDCHLGNLLLVDGVPTFVDLDDCLQGPAIQDLWMLLGGGGAEQRFNLEKLLAGYEEFATFDYRELRLVEPLRSLRMLHHAAWIADRWKDPAFPRAFPGFGEPRFWEGHMQQLREQLVAMDNPPILDT